MVVTVVTFAAGSPIASGQTSPPPGNNNGINNTTQGSINVDQGTGSATIGALQGVGNSGGQGVGNGKGGSGGGVVCQWQLVGTQKGGNGIDPQGNILPGAGGGIDQNGNPVSNSATGTWYLETCPGQAPRSVFVPGGGGAPAPPSPQQLLAQAKNHLQLPLPAVQMSPASTTNPTVDQFVNIPTWVWVDPAAWTPVTATTGAGAVTVRATATPSSLVVDYQDGTGGTKEVRCTGPGTPYSDQLAAAENSQQPILAASPTCGWVWRHSSAGSTDQRLQVSGYVVYALSWTVTGAVGGGPLGPLNSPTSTYRVMVGQIESVITGGS